ncbi:diguanylate cyclase [Sulfurimonas sp.]|uniref:GGDEF domain-containing response regulator n=1 Tax=Sulfurimonas sp. TaxID=2022749 RepID=UPI003567ACFF
MTNVLLVDDSKFIQVLVKDVLLQKLNVEISSSYTLQETKKLLKENHFDVAIVDINLPDAQNGEAIDLTIKHGIPVVVLTAGMNQTSKKIITKKDIVEYITKSDPETIKYVATVVERVLKNKQTHVMIVDDSKSSRKLMKTYLEKLNINVVEATNGQEALEKIEQCKNNLSLIITDNDMDIMNGMELTTKLREKYSKDQLGIIAVSASGRSLATKFLRHGANDFVHKPFTFEEFSSRVNLNLELIDLFKKIKDNANKDFLTGLYNRRYFFENSPSKLSKAKQKHENLAVAMLDIDHFKKINDEYGHDVGDIALKEMVCILQKVLTTSSIVARFGGEEFCLLLEYLELKDLQNMMETLRLEFEKNIIKVKDIEFSYTVSIGLYYGLLDSIEDMIQIADQCLYEAKNSGRNKVIIKQ